MVTLILTLSSRAESTDERRKRKLETSLLHRLSAGKVTSNLRLGMAGQSLDTEIILCIGH